jgi:hypothetical protein
MQGEVRPVVIEQHELQNHEEEENIHYDFSTCKRIKKLTTHE